MANNTFNHDLHTSNMPSETEHEAETPTHRHVIDTEDFVEYPVHNSCPSCKHFHQHSKFKLFSNPARRSSFHCEKCNKPIFAIGRSSTQVTFASAESRPSNPLHVASPLQQICTNRRLQKRQPSNLRAMDFAPSYSSENDLSTAKATASAAVQQGPSMKMYESQGKESSGASTHVSAAGKRWSRSRLFPHTFGFKMFLGIMKRKWRKIQRRDPRPNQPPTPRIEGSPATEESGPTHITRASGDQNHPSHTHSASSPKTPSSEALVAPVPPVFSPDHHHTSSQSFGSPRPSSFPSSEGTPSPSPLEAYRRRRTLIARNATVYICHCGDDCKCKHNVCVPPHGGYDVSSNPCSNDTRRSSPIPSSIPGHVLDRASIHTDGSNGPYSCIPSRTIGQHIGAHLED